MDEDFNIDDNEDIELLLAELDEIRLDTGNIDVLTTFADQYAYPIMVLLEELKKRRYAAKKQGVEDGGRLGSHRIILEGYSENSMEEAFSNALEKAYDYFSALYDVNVTVLELTHIRSGGHRATIELNITLMTMKSRNKKVGADVERKRSKDKHDKNYKKIREVRVEHLLHDHFVTQLQEPNIPDYLLVNVQNAQLLNFMAEHDFFHAAQKKSDHKPHDPNEFVVRVIKPEHGND
jgi:flavin-binding protein dodecin